jgi:hypothetical protein
MKTNSIQLEEENIKISNRIVNMKYLQNEEQIGVLFKVEKYKEIKSTDRKSNSSIVDSSFIDNGKSLLVFSTNDQYYGKYSTFLREYDLNADIKFRKELKLWSQLNCYVAFNGFIIYAFTKVINIYKTDSISNYNRFQLGKPVEYSRCLSISADTDYIYTLNSFYTVDVYNWSLMLVEKIGQNENESEPFYFDNVQQMDIRNKKFYLRRPDGINIVDEKDGKVLKTIEIDSYKFIIDDDDKQLVVFENDSICRYQLDSGDFISKIDTKGSIPNGFTFLNYKDNKYILLSKNKKELYSIIF